MTQHKKFDMLVAKGQNMDLAILLKYPDLPKWEISPNAYPPHKDHVEAFLCHPIHLDSCLNGLNGSKVEIKTGTDEWESVSFEHAWSKDGWYMSEENESRLES